MRLRLSFEPDRPDVFRSAGEPDADVAALESESAHDDLTTRLRSLYGKYTQRYTHLVSVDPSTGTPISPDYPPVSFQVAGDENHLVLDGKLFERLCDLYIVHGWSGVQKAEEALKSRQPADDPESGGTNYPRPAPFLAAGYKFFIITRKILAILIRQALGRIQKKATETILARLSVSSVTLATAFKSYGFRSERAVLRAATPSRREKRAKVASYTMSNVATSARLYKICSEAAATKKTLEACYEQLTASRKKQQTLSTSNAPTEMGDARENVEHAAQLVQKIEKEQSRLHDLLVAVRQTDPCILLVIPSLQAPFSGGTFEHTTGLILRGMINELDKLATVVDPRVTNVGEFVPWKGEATVSIDDFSVPAAGVEAEVIERAAAANVHALLNAAVLADLVAKGGIPKDSFENVVLFHYLEALQDRLERTDRQLIKSSETWRTIGQISSGVALASLAVPVVGLLAGGAFRLVNLAMVFYAVKEARTGLESLDARIRDELLGGDADGAYSKALADIGQLLNARQEYRDALAKDISIEVVIMLAGATAAESSLIGKATRYRNYYNDVKTLYGE